MSGEDRAALLVGATGLVGQFLTKRLLESPFYSRVTAWVRRPLAHANPKLAIETVDFEQLAARPIDAQDVYCCLGSTIKRAGSQDAFRRVDYEYPVALARRARIDGVRRFLVVSSLGADARSSVFYSRVKGEMEGAVSACGIAQTYFFRPSLIDGPRSESRFGERTGLAIGLLLGPFLGRYRPVHADAVAEAMLTCATRDLEPGIYESDRIRAMNERRSTQR